MTRIYIKDPPTSELEGILIILGRDKLYVQVQCEFYRAPKVYNELAKNEH